MGENRDQDEQLQKSFKILSKVLRQRAYTSQPKAQEPGKNTERPGHYIQNRKEITKRKNQKHQHDP